MLTRIADGIGKGVLAGVAGTAAMTASSTLEAKLRGRPFSTAPAKAAARALGIETFDDGEAYARFSNVVHWGYAIGVGPRLATGTHFAALWGSALYSLPKYEVAPPVTEWAAEDVAVDVFHHLVYVGAAAVAFELLDRSEAEAR